MDDNLIKTPIQITDPAGWFWFMFITISLTGVYFIIFSFVNIADIANNWDKYRCNPLIMPFAKLFGYNTSENFNFCVGNILKNGASNFTGPFASILQTFIGSLMTVMKSLNSFRVVLATLMGGITTIFQEITERFKVLMSNFVQTSNALKRLMGRMFATFYAIIYMGTSGIQAGTNFTNTFLFSFLDTFCFDPNTVIEVENLGLIPIDEVEIGDKIKSGYVTAVYRINADGQQMVKIGPVIVSSNHYILHDNKWIRAEDHPDARKLDPWSGGTSSPLICLDTNTHKISIDKYIFSDYTELDSTDGHTMKSIQDRLNNTIDAPVPTLKYRPGLTGEDYVIMKGGSKKKICNIELGDELSTGKVYGIVRRFQDDIYVYKSTFISGSTLVWIPEKNMWERVYTQPDALESFNHYDTYNLLVMNSGVIETPDLIFRDLMELHDPDIENITAEALAKI